MRMVAQGRLLILYGSETGNGEDLAKMVAWTITSKTTRAPERLRLQVMPCDEYPIDQLPKERLVLFICSTTGVGEEPHNMRRFWRFLLRRDLPSDSLASMSFAVIGLGDSSYQKYNFVAKKLQKRLLNLGAKSLLEMALGDDQHELGPFAKIDPWLRQFYQLVLPSELEDDPNDDGSLLIEPTYKVVLLDEMQAETYREPTENAVTSSQEGKSEGEVESVNPCAIATVVANDRVTAEEHFQDVRLIGLAIEAPFQYSLGDVCSVYPENGDEEVEAFLGLFEDAQWRCDSRGRLLRLDLRGESVCIGKSSIYQQLLQPGSRCSVEQLVKRYLDIGIVPKRSFFHLFHRFSRSDLERDLLRRFALGVDLDELLDYVHRPKRTILEVMADFPHTTPHVPLEYLLDLIPPISARPYSIASAPATSPERIDLLYAVVHYRTRLRKPRLGLCTNWMARLRPGDRARIFLRPSNFALPRDHSERPLVMVGAGTGVAPFRAFIHHRVNSEVAGNWLFFGCRYRHQDYFLAEEWRRLADRALLTVFEAFSRESGNESKVYVQNRLWEQRQLLSRLLLSENGLLWVAGKSQQYPQLVRQTLADILKEQMNDAEEEQVQSLLTQLELKKRIRFECW